MPITLTAPIFEKCLLGAAPVLVAPSVGKAAAEELLLETTRVVRATPVEDALISTGEVAVGDGRTLIVVLEVLEVPPATELPVAVCDAPPPAPVLVPEVAVVLEVVEEGEGPLIVML